jgi:hypothetical protein
MLQQRHFEFIAETLREQIEREKADGNAAGVLTLARTVRAFSIKCSGVNPRFKPSVFLKACGITEA